MPVLPGLDELRRGAGEAPIRLCIYGGTMPLLPGFDLLRGGEEAALPLCIKGGTMPVLPGFRELRRPREAGEPLVRPCR